MFRLELNSVRPDALEEIAENMNKAINKSTKILISPIYRLDDMGMVHAVNLSIGESNENDIYIGVDVDFHACVQGYIDTEDIEA